MPKEVKKMVSYPAPPPIGELTTAIHINVDEIPDHVRDDLAATVLDFIIRLKKEGLLPQQEKGAEPNG